MDTRELPFSDALSHAAVDVFKLGEFRDHNAGGSNSTIRIAFSCITQRYPNFILPQFSKRYRRAKPGPLDFDFQLLPVACTLLRGCATRYSTNAKRNCRFAGRLRSCCAQPIARAVRPPLSCRATASTLGVVQLSWPPMLACVQGGNGIWQRGPEHTSAKPVLDASWLFLGR